MPSVEIRRNRKIDPFFFDAIDKVFTHSHKQIFLMDGPIGLGKTSNFLMLGSYLIAQCVEPVKRGNRMVRQSLWAGIRESENTAVATFEEVISDALFSPEIMADPNGPVKIHSSHPTYIDIKHRLEDGTYLDMRIECHGFNHPESKGRLQSRSFVGALIPECQNVPWSIVEIARQRTGRWRPSTTIIRRKIGNKIYTLSGAANLKIVLADANIPERPHPMYDLLYDADIKKQDPYMIIRPPPPILPKPIESAPRDVIEKYPTTFYEGKQVVWIPNPDSYFMQAHFEEMETDESTGEFLTNEDGSVKTIPYTGYSYWFKELKQSHSIIRRHILGLPEKMGGEYAIYTGFSAESHVIKKQLPAGADVWCGYDPGKYASFVFMFEFKQDDGYGGIRHGIHVFHEITFEPSDGLLSRPQIEMFVMPYIKSSLQGHKVEFVPDPYAWVSTNQGEGAAYVLKEVALKEGISSRVKVSHCKAPNQDTDSRIGKLGYFVDQNLFTVDPDCEMVRKGMLGGYCLKRLKNGGVSSEPDKSSPYSHAIESVQYPCINIYLKRVHRKEKNIPTGMATAKAKHGKRKRTRRRRRHG